ncbi:MAG TPA: ankyrin repeat domain-containing protein [Bryobacteraceae bacterium]|jgi:hemoglobin
MASVDLYQKIGGRTVCRQLSEAFYARVKQDPVLRPFFPGKSMRCAIEAFTAFLAQFLGGPAEDAEKRWWLSLRESHHRFQIGARERQAWMAHMIEALDEVAIEEPLRHALRSLFERSSAYLVNQPAPPEFPPGDCIYREIAQRWTEQRALDDLVAAIRGRDAARSLVLALSPGLANRIARDRAVFAHVLGLMIGCGQESLLQYAEQELRADPALASIRNRYGRTLLHDAAAHGNLRMVELLLRLGADPNVGMTGGHTPLYCVANECQAAGGGDIVRALVRAGAQVNSSSGAKACTPLHLAARRGNTEIAEALIDCGADMNLRDKSGDTPLRRAQNCRKTAVASLLASRALP